MRELLHNENLGKKNGALLLIGGLIPNIVLVLKSVLYLTFGGSHWRTH